MSNNEVYLGDGLYARYNGQEIWLRADEHKVCLDTGMLKRIQGIVDDYEKSADQSQYCVVDVPDKR